MSDFMRVQCKTFDGTTLRDSFFRVKGERMPVLVMTKGLTLLKGRERLETYLPKS